VCVLYFLDQLVLSNRSSPYLYRPVFASKDEPWSKGVNAVNGSGKVKSINMG
jgi:hypothetical protein